MVLQACAGTFKLTGISVLSWAEHSRLMRHSKPHPHIASFHRGLPGLKASTLRQIPDPGLPMVKEADAAEL